MIDRFVELCVQMIYFVPLASWRALPVFAVIAIVTLVIRNRVPARYLCWLWVIVIARLLIPVSVTSVMAISSVADAPVQALFSSHTEANSDSAGFDIFTYEDEEGKPVSKVILPRDATAEQRAKGDAYLAQMTADEKEALAAYTPRTHVKVPTTGQTALETFEPLLIALSCLMVFGLPTVAIALLIRGIVSHPRFASRLWFIPAICDRATVDCLLRVCDDVGVGRRPKMKEVPWLHAPAVFGLLRPVVCLPSGWREELTLEQLDWVLRHELAHVKSRDGLVLFVASMARSLHWFNPLAWIAVSKLQHNMERAADQMATRDLDDSKIREYGELLLRYAAGQESKRQPVAVGLLAMAVPRGLQGRIESLSMKRTTRRWLLRITMLPLIAILAASGLTDAKTVEQVAEASHQIPNFEVVLAGTDWRKATSTLDGQISPQDLRIVSINVERALQKARELQPGVDAEKFVVNYLGFFPVAANQRDKTKIADSVMTVNVTQRQEALLRQMLSAFEASGPWQVATELKIIETDMRMLNQFDWLASDSTLRCRRLERKPLIEENDAWDATFSFDAMAWPPQETVSQDIEQYIQQAASIPVRAIKISRLQSERLLHQVQQDTRSNVMQAPKVTMFNGQCGMISDVVHRPFVTDVLEGLAGNATALQPKISVFEDGWRLLMRSTVNDEEKVSLQLVLTHSSVDGVKLANLPHLGSNDLKEKVTIQVPTVRSNSIAVESVLDANEALLVFSPTPYSHETGNQNQASRRPRGQLFMVRTQLFSDHEVLKSFVVQKTDK